MDSNRSEPRHQSPEQEHVEGSLSVSQDDVQTDSQSSASESSLNQSSPNETVERSTGVASPLPDDGFKDRVTHLNLNLHVVSNDDDREFLRDLPNILSTHPHVYTYIKGVEISDVPDNYRSSEDCQLHQRVLEALITHANQVPLEVVKVENLAWLLFTQDMRRLTFRLICSFPILRTLSLHVRTDLYPYTLDFLDTLSGLEDFTFVDVRNVSLNYIYSRSPYQVLRDTNNLTSPRAMSQKTRVNHNSVFLRKLYVGGEAAKMFADYLDGPHCSIKLSQLLKLQIESQGEQVGNGVTRILNKGASESISSLAWCPSSMLLAPFPLNSSAFGSKKTAVAKEMHPRSLILTNPCHGVAGFGMHRVFSFLSPKFRVNSSSVEELVLCYHSIEKPDPSIPYEFQSGPDNIMYSISLVLQQADEDFKTLCSTNNFAKLQVIKLWLSLTTFPESWGRLTELGQIESSYWTPSMGGDWVSSNDWTLAKNRAPEMHSKTFLLRIVPDQESSKIFKQMNLDSL